MFKEDAELVIKLAREHLHSAFDTLPNSKLDFSLVEDKQIEETTVGDIAAMLLEAGRIPTKDRDKIDVLLGNKVLIPKNQGMKHIRSLFESLSLNATFSDRFLDIFRNVCIKTSMYSRAKNSPKTKTISIGCNLNRDWWS